MRRGRSAHGTGNSVSTAEGHIVGGNLFPVTCWLNINSQENMNGINVPTGNHRLARPMVDVCRRLEENPGKGQINIFAGMFSSIR